MRGRSGWRRSGGGNGGGGVGGPMFQTGPPGPYGAPVPPHPGPVYACWPAPFDLTLCEATFPRAKEVEDSDLAQAINKRHQEIMPTSAEQSAVVSLVNKVKGALQKIASNPDQSASMVLEEFREVGSFRKETMLAGHNVADIVVVFRSLPTCEFVQLLCFSSSSI
ncbi:unnamed protein product [Anisakis simplex]|uniref:Interleukin enhancer-binding factor 2 (inferred by orthology to a human protein) n=1 Tax=Anisakis simplex TaxID=6269 RepID=A0A0M3J8T4_ANISI|nr:unnamed protein product [Anisakis simplex]